jgi:hypothetical protein
LINKRIPAHKRCASRDQRDREEAAKARDAYAETVAVDEIARTVEYLNDHVLKNFKLGLVMEVVDA